MLIIVIHSYVNAFQSYYSFSTFFTSQEVLLRVSRSLVTFGPSQCISYSFMLVDNRVTITVNSSFASTPVANKVKYWA